MCHSTTVLMFCYPKGVYLLKQTVRLGCNFCTKMLSQSINNDRVFVLFDATGAVAGALIVIDSMFNPNPIYPIISN